MKFKYYVTDLSSGSVKGTNNDATANELADSEDFFVVNAETGNWLTSGSVEEIQEGFLDTNEEDA